MNILFVHQNFPGQFRGLAPALRAAGHVLRAVSMRTEKVLAGVDNFQYFAARGSSASIHPWLVSSEAAVIRGEAVAALVTSMVTEGWVPDVVVGHTGWGEMLFLRQVLPDARLVGFNELFYDTSVDQNVDQGVDQGVGELGRRSLDAQRLVVRNFHLMSSLLACDVNVTPTVWQASCFPPVLRERLSVVHDGILTHELLPDRSAWVSLEREGLRFCFGDEVVTFVNRNLEPMRGYDQFMRALPQILRVRPKAHVVIVGGDGVSYGAHPPEGKTFKQIFLDEVRDELDMSRVHFVSRVPYDTLLSLLRVSAVHVYLTLPFVLSWSLLEAMSLGALVVGSDTGPVREVVAHGVNGLLVDFFDPVALADVVCEVLADPVRFEPLRGEARRTVVERFDFDEVCLPRYVSLIEGV